jgi:hypothetical protein
MPSIEAVMPRLAVTVTAVAVVAVAVVSGQAKWPFAGKWITTDTVVGGWGKAPNIGYPTPTTLQVGVPLGDGFRLLYRLDGRESKNTIVAPDGTTRTVVSRATLEGERLRISTATPLGDELIILYRDGSALVREEITPGRDGRPAATTKTVYTKN